MYPSPAASRFSLTVLGGAVVLAALFGEFPHAFAAGPTTTGLQYPGVSPGPMAVTKSEGAVTMGNQAIRVSWPLGARGLGTPTFKDNQTGRSLSLNGDLFEVLLADGTIYTPSRLVGVGPVIVRELPLVPGASRLAARARAQVIEAPMRAADGSVNVVWRAIGTDDANYVRQELEITAVSKDSHIQSITWVNESMPGARTLGKVDGSVVAAGNFFLGCEDPHAINQPLVCQLQRNAVLKRGDTVRASFVCGVAPENQLRRAFLYYLERERAHPFRPYLHYNSWYDIAWSPFALNETNCLEAIRLFGDRFIIPYGVTMDGMVFDDGWDDPKSLWRFHKGFPNGFTPLAALCKQYNTRLGVWLSPFGGYGEPKEQRIKFGSAQGYETNATGFSLAGPKYYQAFKNACVGMIRNYGVNHFKFDGIAGGMYASGGGQYLLDTEAMRRLMLELRQEEPDVYINLTTGSWPSPFWLRFADSLWRQGGDMGHAGKGSKQQQWITYRDQETCRNIVGKGPLYPLNALMSQGVAYSRNGMAGEPSFNSAGFRDDVRGFFGSGTSLQELYIQPGRLSTEDWVVLAEAAKWSRANADVLVDAHWVGGDPGKGEVYGYASWNARKGIVMLRNPDDQPHEITLDIGKVFELPPSGKTAYMLKSPWAEQQGEPEIPATAGKVITMNLKPFEVRVLDALPTAGAVSSEQSSLPALVPQPVRFVAASGAFPLSARTGVVIPGSDDAERMKTAETLRRAVALKLPLASEPPPEGVIRVALDSAFEAQLGKEGYRLKITPDAVRIQAAAEAGVFYAGITLRQMLTPDAFGPAARESTRVWQLPCAEIEDVPRFTWRGLLVDPARHFLPVEFLKRFVDLMALHKFNMLQIHLTDDQGWRMEIKKYPRLTEIGSVRKESPRHGDASQGDGVPYGPFFYTQDQLRDLVAYAKARQVTILPEIEMPGHFRAALAAYPQNSCTGGPFEVRTRWGVESDVLCPGNDEAVRFALGVLDEVTQVFPSPFIHIGGDEAPRVRWKACPKCQARMKTEGFTREAQLQTWLNQRIEEFLTSKGRRMIGWDEILEGGLTPGATVMSWRGMDGGIAAAQAGHDVVMSPTTHCYLDYAQARDADEPESIGGLITLETVYAFEPVPPTLSVEKRAHILGGQGNIWSEFIWNGKDVEYFAFPRAAALSEVLWSPASSHDFAEFKARLTRHLPRLEALNVNYRRDPGSVRPPQL